MINILLFNIRKVLYNLIYYIVSESYVIEENKLSFYISESP